jgi:hypothetical protein
MRRQYVVENCIITFITCSLFAKYNLDDGAKENISMATMVPSYMVRIFILNSFGSHKIIKKKLIPYGFSS